MTEVEFNRQRALSLQLPFAIAFPLSMLVSVRVENTIILIYQNTCLGWCRIGRVGKGNTLQLSPGSTFIMVS